MAIYAHARRRVSSTKLAFLLDISQPAAWNLIRKLRPVWWELWDNILKVLERFDFIELPPVPPWTFFSERPRTLKRSIPATMPAGAYDLSPEEMLLRPEHYPSPEQMAVAAAARQSQEKLRKAEDWARKSKQPGKRMEGFLAWLEQQKKEINAHNSEHRQSLPFKWLPRRDCPMCRFGEREWRHWEAVAVQFGLALFEEFWDWIEDLNRQAAAAKETARYEEVYGPYVPPAPTGWDAVRRELEAEATERQAEFAREMAELSSNPDVAI